MRSWRLATFALLFTVSAQATPVECRRALAPPLTLLVEGAGDVVQRFYSPALRAAKERLEQRGQDVRVIFADESAYWRGNPALAAKMEQTIQSVRAWGGEYLDKSDPVQNLAYLQDVRPNFVFVATPDFTHLAVASHWTAVSPSPVVFIEKPLDSSLDRARQFIGDVGRGRTDVYAFDHYRAKLYLTPKQLREVKSFLGGKVEQIEFFFLEDRSGADPAMASASRDGAIENEQRTRALNEGVVMDGLSHMPPLLEYFGLVPTLQVSTIRAGQYLGVDGDPSAKTEIAGETFAQVGFQFQDPQGRPIQGSAYVGKGIRGVERLGAQYDRNTKVMIVHGARGNHVLFDLRSSGEGSSMAYFRDASGRVRGKLPLSSTPYVDFIRRVTTGHWQSGTPIAFSVETAKQTLQFLHDIRASIRAQATLPVYPGGMRGLRESPTVESLVRSLPLIYGKESGQ